MISEHPDFYLPNLATLQNDNAWLGSFHGLRFRVKPDVKADPPTVEALVWYGELCFELSTVEASAVFPLDEVGYAQVLAWLDEQFRVMQERAHDSQ